MSLFSFQGKVSLGDRLPNGKLSKPIWCGNVPTCQLQLKTDSTDKTESFSGNRLQYGRLQKGKTATLNLTFDEWLSKNLTLGLYATELSVAAGSATGESLPSGLVAGDQVKLDHPFVSSLVITDSAGTPATVPPANYSLDSANAGLLTLNDVGAFVQPFKAAYSYEAAKNLTIFTAAPPERYFLLDGINTETGEPVIVHLYRVRFDPISQLDLITDDYGNLPMVGSVLYDVVNAADANLGGFGKIEQKAA